MNKETITEAMKLEFQLEKRLNALEEKFVKQLSDEPTTPSAIKAKQACQAISEATGDLHKALVKMFCRADDTPPQTEAPKGD